MKEEKIIQPQMTNAFKDGSDFSPRSPAYKPPHSQGQKLPPIQASNANIDLKLKLFKEQFLEELVALAAAGQLIVDGGNLDA